MFVSWLAQSLAPASVAVHLASLRSLHQECGDQVVSTTAITPIPNQLDCRLPITNGDLKSLHIQLSVVPSDIDATMF